jgi:3-oxoacyl-[acyl-carrier-protein] synthase III
MELAHGVVGVKKKKAKAGPGRPTKPIKTKKVRRLSIAMTTDEEKRVEKAAKIAGKMVSRFLRDAALAAADLQLLVPSMIPPSGGSD